MQLNNGDARGAVISAVWLIPYAGDIVKTGKVKKDIGIINNAIETANKGKKGFVTFISKAMEVMLNL